MAAVTFPANLGGDGNTYSDDADPNTGLDNGGHRARFVPALGQALAMASTARDKAAAAASSEASASASASSAASDAAQTMSDRNATSADAAAAANSASAAGSSATSANNSLLALGDVLANGIGAFSVDANGDLNVSWNEPTVDDITINADGDLIVTYPA